MLQSRLPSLFRAAEEIGVVMATLSFTHQAKNILWNLGNLGLQKEADSCLYVCTSVVICLMQILKVVVYYFDTISFPL
jgi:hypothetical protein